MIDPRRLGSEDPQAAALFAAARAYRPPARARRRILRALGIPVGLSLLGSALAHAAHALAPFKGWIVAGTIAAASAGGGVVYLSQQEGPPRTPAAMEEPRVAKRSRPRTPARPAAVAAEPSPVAPPVVAPIAPLAPAPRPRPAPPRISARASQILRQVAQADLPRPAPAPVPEPTSSPAPAPASAVAMVPAPVEVRTSFDQVTPPAPRAPAPAPQLLPRSTLAQELTLIEKARAELEQSSPRRALVTLDEYARSFPGGALLEESELLRVSALEADGDHLEAVAAARAFLVAHPRSPLAARARTFLPVDPSK
jgi:hypothetical protein